MTTPIGKEVDTYTVRWMIGAIAFSLPTLLIVACWMGLLKNPPTSISASYLLPQSWTRDVFVGSMFALASLLLAYNGRSGVDWTASKVGCIGAVVLATNRCVCDGMARDFPMPSPEDLHAIGTGAVISVLLYFCGAFMHRAWRKYKSRMLVIARMSARLKRTEPGTPATEALCAEIELAKHQKSYIERRMVAYGAAVLLQCCAVIPYFQHQHSVNKLEDHGVFWAEALTLWAFSLCWYTSARTNIFLEHRSLRKKLFRP